MDGTYRAYMPLAGTGQGPTAPPVGGEGKEEGIVRTDYMEEIWWRMVRDPQQGRVIMSKESRLMAAAMVRVVKMAHEGWVGHTDLLGMGPDWYVRKSGYLLPPWYMVEGEGEAGNHVESLGWGGWWGTPVEEIWGRWMNSPLHRLHILGQETYAGQTNVGIAVYYLAESKEKMYISVITAPPEVIYAK